MTPLPEVDTWVTVYPTTAPTEPLMAPGGAPLELRAWRPSAWQRFVGWFDRVLERVCVALVSPLHRGTLETP